MQGPDQRQRVLYHVVLDRPRMLPHHVLARLDLVAEEQVVFGALQRLLHVEMVEKQHIHGPKLQERKTASRLLPHPLRHTGFEFGFDL